MHALTAFFGILDDAVHEGQPGQSRAPEQEIGECQCQNDQAESQRQHSMAGCGLGCYPAGIEARHHAKGQFGAGRNGQDTGLSINGSHDRLGEGGGRIAHQAQVALKPKICGRQAGGKGRKDPPVLRGDGPEIHIGPAQQDIGKLAVQ